MASSDPEEPSAESTNDIIALILEEDLSLEELEQSFKADSVDVPDKDGRTPLMLACIKGLDDFVKVLLRKGANPNIQSRDGNTALHFACMKGKAVDMILGYYAVVPPCKRLAILEALIERGAVLQNNKNGLNPPCLAAFCGLTDVVDYFEQCSNVNIPIEDKIKAREILGVYLLLGEDHKYIEGHFEKGHAAFCCAMSYQQSHPNISTKISSQPASGIDQTTLREFETLEDLHKAKESKQAMYAHALLVSERVLPQCLRQEAIYMYDCSLQFACDALYRVEAPDIGYQLLLQALGFESSGALKFGSVLDKLAVGIRRYCHKIPLERVFPQTVNLLAQYESVLQGIHTNQLLAEYAYFIGNLGEFAFNIAFYNSNFQYLESLLLMLENLVRCVNVKMREEKMNMLPTVTHTIMDLFGEAFADCMYCGMDTTSQMRVMYVICRLLFLENPAYQNESKGDTVLHSFIKMSSMPNFSCMLNNLGKAFVRHGCPLDAVNKEGDTALDIGKKRENDDDDEYYRDLIAIVTPPTSPLKLEELALRAVLLNQVPFRELLPPTLCELVEGESSEAKLKQCVLDAIEHDRNIEESKQRE